MLAADGTGSSWRSSYSMVPSIMRPTSSITVLPFPTVHRRHPPLDRGERNVAAMGWRESTRGLADRDTANASFPPALAENGVDTPNRFAIIPPDVRSMRHVQQRLPPVTTRGGAAQRSPTMATLGNLPWTDEDMRPLCAQDDAVEEDEHLDDEDDDDDEDLDDDDLDDDEDDDDDFDDED